MSKGYKVTFTVEVASDSAAQAVMTAMYAIQGDVMPLVETEGEEPVFIDESGRIHARCRSCGKPTRAGDEDYCVDCQMNERHL